MTPSLIARRHLLWLVVAATTLVVGCRSNDTPGRESPAPANVDIDANVTESPDGGPIGADEPAPMATTIVADPTAEPTIALIAEEDAAAAIGTAEELDVAVARDFHPEVGSLVFRLLGTPADGPGETSMVTTIEVRDGDLPAVRQILGTFEARARLDPYAGASDPYGGFFIEDLDFDGFPDLRLEAREADETDTGATNGANGDTGTEVLEAGGTSSAVEANVPFLFWRYDSTAGRFQRDEALAEIVSPEVDAVERVIRSTWRADESDVGTDTWAWQEGRPVRIARERRYVREDGETVTQFYRRDDESGELKLVEEIIAGEAPEQ